MVRKPTATRTRFGVGAVYCLTAIWLAEGAVGADIGRAGQKIEERIEIQLNGGGISSPDLLPVPERTHEDSIEPWELVSV